MNTQSSEIRAEEARNRWGCTASEWDDWHWQVRNRIQTVAELHKFIALTDTEKQDIAKVLQVFRMGITPYYASLMDPNDPRCPIRRQAIPNILETLTGRADMQDPLSEEK